MKKTERKTSRRRRISESLKSEGIIISDRNLRDRYER